MTNKSSLTIDDIARELGVSKTTVSRAISGKGRISAATRERVQAYIEEHNYKPNASAKSLAESRTYNLALVLPRDFIKLDIPFMRQTMSAIVDEAFIMNYNVMICLSTDTDASHLIHTLDYRKVDGVILTSAAEKDPIKELLIRRDIPFAILGELSFNSAEVGRAACRELIHALNDESYDPKPLLGYKIHMRQSML